MAARRFASVSFVVAIAWLTAAAPTRAQDDLQAAHGDIEAARGALERSDADTAERLLTGIAETAETINDLDFLRGTAAFTKKNYQSAIDHFRALLARDPSLNRVRLDLARAYFAVGDDEAAEFHFRAALAQGVPPEVQANITRYLTEIKRRKRWSVDVSVAVAPDTNINTSTTAQSIDLFGLPFELSDSAKQKSGVGIASNFLGEYRLPMGDAAALRTDLTFYDAEYKHEKFSDRNLALAAGPEWRLSPDTTIATLATGGLRWYGGHKLTNAVGGRVESAFVLSPRYILAVTASGQYLDYAGAYTSYTGPVFSTDAQLTYAPDAISFVRIVTGIVREQTRVRPLRDTQYVFGAGYYRESLPGGFAAYGAVRATVASYDAPFAAFGVTRHDFEMNYRLSVSNKRLDFFGFTPLVSYIHVDRYSNLDLYRYHRNRGEIGVTRNF